MRLLLALLLASPLAVLTGHSAMPAQIVPPTVIQHKACPVLARSCTFDAPVAPDALIVVVALGCNPVGQYPANCNLASDSQGNTFQRAIVVPYYNGLPLLYALDAKGGPETIYFAENTANVAVIAEYPPSSGLEDANYGTYAFNNPHGDPNGGSSDMGDTMPVIASSGDLLVSWGWSGGPWGYSGASKITAGPYFTLRDTSELFFMFEDSVAPTDGVYIGSVNWNAYGHWVMGAASFKMKMRVQ